MSTPRNSSDPALARYIERVRAIPRLSREVEAGLARSARGGDDEAVQTLVEANLRFAVAAALQYQRYRIPLAELIAEANLGLTIAARKFDPEKGTRFVTYAGYWIRAHVLDLVVKSASLVGGGSGVLRSKLYFRLRRERARIAALETENEAVVERLAEQFGVAATKMTDMLARLDARDLSLNRPVHADSESTLLDNLRAEDQDASERFDDARRQARMEDATRGALATLDERERYIVERRILDDDSESLAELGRQLGVSRERARQLEARAKTKLRAQLSGFSAAYA